MQSPHGSAYHPLASITGCSGESGYRLSIPVFWASVGDFFGRKSFGAIRGNMNLFYTWGSILGPFIAGAIYDRTQSYVAGLYRHHDCAPDFHRDDGALDQAVGKNWNKSRMTQ